ncbi:CDP-alcohol phosphatidyltransferase family protein [Hyphomonadaceae bacterium ML37]|nr:CDP-alcohol phosphatidyltransferase family protein [Hyphomonadaceae bacterium ML37]
MTISTNSPLHHLPNAVTLARMAAGVFGAYCLAVSVSGDVQGSDLIWGAVAAVIYILAALSDWLDGWLAEILDARSALGALLDPLADKVLVGGYLIAFLTVPSWSEWLLVPVALIVGRDLLVTILRFTRPSTATLKVTKAAKAKTAFTMSVIAAPFALVTVDLATPINLAPEAWFVYWAVGIWFAAFLSAWTAVPYVRGAMGRG